MKKYKTTTLTFGLAMFFGLGTFDKIIAQTKWDFINLGFAVAFCLFTALWIGRGKNDI